MTRLIGLWQRRCFKSECENSHADRRSLYVVWDMKAGDVMTKENLRAIRPGIGLPTKYLGQVLGKTVKQDVKRGTALSWGMMG